MKKIGLVLCLLLLTGCMKSSPFTVDSSVDAVESSTEESSPIPDVEEIPENPEPEGPAWLHRLSCLQEKGRIQQMLAIRDGRVLILAATPTDEDVQILSNQPNSYLYLVDVQADRLVAAEVLPSNDQVLLGVRPNGEIWMMDYSTDEIRIYNDSLTFERSREPFPSWPYFDFVHDCAYYMNGSHLMRHTLSTDTEEALLNNALRAYIALVDDQGGRIVLDQGDPEGLADCCYYVYEVESGELVETIPSDYAVLYPCGGGLLLEGSHYTEEASENYLRIVRAAGDTAYQLSTDGILYTSAATDSVLHAEWVDPMADLVQIRANMLQMLRPTDGTQATLETGLNGYLRDAVFDSATGAWVLGLSDDTEGVMQLAVLDPDKLAYDEQLTPYVFPDSEATAVCGAHLQEIRARADELEARYDVDIVIGDEMTNMETGSFYTLVSTEDPAYSPGEEAEIEELNWALAGLEEVLSRYPDGFFDEFKGIAESGGIRFIYVRDLLNETGDFKAGAEQCMSSVWYNIIVDADETDANSLHHELWHAVEMRVSDEDITAFEDAVWMALNPEGFAYWEDFDTYADYAWSDEIAPYLLYYGDDPWFARDYSVVNAREDRATLIEAVYGKWEDDPGSWPENYPHLQAKLDFLAKAITPVFGGAYWE